MAFVMVPNISSNVVTNDVGTVGKSVTIEPRDTDILCIRGGATMRHPGTQTYRKLVAWNKVDYVTCPDSEKIKISRSIVATLREQDRRFLSKDQEGNWYDIGDKKAIEKTSQALRERQPEIRRNLAEPLQLTEPSDEPISSDQQPLPFHVPSTNFHKNDDIFFKAAAIEQPLQRATLDGSERGVSEVYTMPPQSSPDVKRDALDGSLRGVSEVDVLPPASPPFVQPARVQRDIFYSPNSNFHHRDIPVSSPHLRDIAIDSLDVSDRPPPVQDRLLASMLHQIPIKDIESEKVSTVPPLHQQPSALSGLGVSVRTVESTAMNSIDTFHTMKSDASMKSINEIEARPIDSLQQNPDAAPEIPNAATSQLSLLSGISRAESNQSGAGRGNEGDGMSVDSLQQFLEGMSFTGASQNLGSQKLAEINEIRRLSDQYNTTMMSSRSGHLNQQDRQKSNVTTTPIFSQINMGGINESQMSCVTTHSAFDVSKHVIQTNSSSSNSGRQIESNNNRPDTDLRKTFARMKRTQNHETSDESKQSLLANEDANEVKITTSIDALGDILTGTSNYSFLSEMAMSTTDDFKPALSLDDKKVETAIYMSNPDHIAGDGIDGSRMSGLGQLSEISLFSGLSEKTGDLSLRLPTWAENITPGQTDGDFAEEKSIVTNSDAVDSEEEVPQRGVMRMGGIRNL